MCLLKNAEHYKSILNVESFFFSGEDAFHGFEGFFIFISLETLSTTPGKWWNEFGWETSPKDIGRYTNYGSSIEHGIDATSGKVAHKKATKL